MPKIVDRFRKGAGEKGSRIVLALDPPQTVKDPINWGRALLDEVHGYVVAVKVGLPLIMDVGIRSVEGLLDGYEDLLWIADTKMADVSHVNKIVAELLTSAGFEALIAHGFVGMEGGLDGLLEADLGILIVSYMSHPGGRLFFEAAFGPILELVKEAGFDGVIAPATFPEKVKEARKELGPGFLILSPGVGAQGAAPGDAIAAGADAEIIGRGIYGGGIGEAAERARRLRDEANEKAAR